jgi:tRNA (guanine37-N1)-methyltransferase
MRIDVVSIFPDYLAPLKLSLVGKAISSGLVDVRVHDLRDWTHDRHRTVDDTPYGGGAGMVMRPEPWGEALDELVGGEVLGDLVPADREGSARLLVFTPSGRVFDQRFADELKDEEHLVLACGRYEGIDARVVEDARTRMRVDEVSIGDYVLNGGEAAALVVVEAVVRLVPGVIGNPESLTEESHSAGQDGLLEYPVYTKPPSWRGLEVPAVLFSGHHAQIAAWRREQALARTAERRPDLLPAPDVPDELELTTATAQDAGELYTLQLAAFFGEARLNESMNLPPLMQTYAELRESLGQGEVLVARQGGRLVASVRAEVADDGAWYIGRLMVAPDQQGRGLGARLMAEIERRAPESCRVFRLLTGALSAANLAFYGRRGYVEVSRRTPVGEVEVVTLEKRLS